MPKDHIIPKFILRGFAINPEANKQNQKIMIYNKETKQIKTEKIADAYALRDFNSPELEKLLAQEYESKVAKIFQRITNRALSNKKNITLSNSEYRLLFRFFVIMWRRNDIQIDKARKMCVELENMLKDIFGESYYDMIKPEFKNITIEDIFNEQKDELMRIFYEKSIAETNDDDPTVLKTIKYYQPFIVYNKSDIHFLLHNTYATLRYFLPKQQKEVEYTDIPSIMIYPISNKLCFCMLFSKNEIDINQESFNLSIETWNNNDKIKEFFIDGYITNTATSLVVDNTNVQFVK
ncbi:MAG: DUF4238 domain-containing protein [Anaeroplasmataceae bacterium]|nr:DUF4238 domain-containing protein [Anaeroplasmataceae bacterium]